MAQTLDISTDWEAYAALHREVRAHRLRDLAWSREAVPELRALAKRYPSRNAFVLGKGASIDALDAETFARMRRRHLVLTINDLPAILHGRFGRAGDDALPMLVVLLDRLTGAKAERCNAGFAAMTCRVVAQYPHGHARVDWIAPMTCIDPLWDGSQWRDIEFGLSCSPRVCKFNRSVWVACHMGRLLGFDVHLLGVDHSEEYIEGDSLRAELAFPRLREEAESHGRRVYQCGTQAAFGGLPRRSVEEALTEEGWDNG
jgi:hypothetical protein